ncbi:DegT/DnrJ/EryC1/StrS aminotransferase family protein [Luteitalea sp. TBR-22]|uniref:DegT/DnrJ/EryC1/StrS family aminotransferase n=1 Tax=Luteitalea sp. TBR-22 TaxID=2802971 RepID=UPI001EF558A5|nr:DegT/DnrJ/EryC1/StrS family aminotransferase [Luteitalea sp. TBR-22]
MPITEKHLHVPFVDLQAQYASIKTEVDAAIADVLNRTSFIGGPQVKSFEEEFARYCGVGHCVGVANGTDAIAIALRALGIGAGHEVITAANSFIATSEAITMAGASPVFVDIDPRTCNIDVSRIEEKITAATRAIVPVHLYGQPADMDPIRDIAFRHGLRIVGDAAQAHGALYRQQPIATLADATCYSFYPGKNLGAYGDAGAIVTADADVATRARMIANHGRIAKYDHTMEGVNSRLDGLQAAILRVKLAHLERWTEARRSNAARYTALLQETPVTLPYELPDVRAVYHLYVVRVPAARRDAIQASLKTSGIETGIHYPIALPHLEAYRHLGHAPADFPEALRASGDVLSLPMFPELSGAQADHVVNSLRSCL